MGTPGQATAAPAFRCWRQNGYMYTYPMATQVSDNHRNAHREGMERSRAVGKYLEALYEHRPRRGRKRSPENMRSRLATIEKELPTATGVARLRMMQEQKNLQRELAEAERSGDWDLAALERDFIRHAKAFGEREGIEYSTWIACGVPREVLAKADIRPQGARPASPEG